MGKRHKKKRNELEQSATETVWIHYDAKLAAITRRTHESALVSKNCPFHSLFIGILKSYPEIEKRYPPMSRMLAFVVNNAPPELDTNLKNGDVVSLWIQDKPGEIISH